MKARPAFVLYYGLGRQPIGIYTEAFRVVACMRMLVDSKQVRFVDAFKVERWSVKKGCEFTVENRDVTNSFIKACKNA